MEILFQNSSIVVCIKPHGIPSQESQGENMIGLLKEATGCESIYPVHRLDTVTAGVMVYAKTQRAAAFLTKEIQENRFKKEYVAIVHGVPAPEEGIMEDLLFKDSKRNKSFVVKRERKGVKKASLEYRTLESKDGLSLVKIKLHTGRTHQIRVQFASRRHPVFGDGKYGASDNVPYIALYSHRITLREPESGEEMSFRETENHSLPDFTP